MFRNGLAILAFAILQTQPLTFAQDATPVSDPAGEVATAIEAYVTSFNDKNAKQFSELWSTDAVYTDRTSGDQFVGRAAIEAEFDKVFARENVPALSVHTESLDFISPSVALARGTATATVTDAEPIESGFSVVYVKRDGRWLIDHINEDVIAVVDARHEALNQLEFMIGQWICQNDGVTIESSSDWTENQAYISNTYKVSSGGQVQSSGLQIIGWDPTSKQICSWLFDSSGTFVSGIWTNRDEKWVVQSVATLSDGGRGSFTNVYRPQADGSYTWEKMNQVLDGQLLPNAAETIVQRK